MTSASELFYTRRSRFGRNTIELGFDSSVDRVSHHSHNNRRHHNHIHNNRRDRSDLDNCESLRRSFSSAHLIHRPLFPELESIRLDQGSSQSGSGNGINPENYGSIRNRHRFGGSDRLPGAVLLARERLLERLRGVSSSGNRASSVIHEDFALGANTRIVDPEDWVGDFNSQIDGGLALHETRNRRPPGLTQETLDCLHMEVFSNLEKSGERASRECSICLESFLEGDELVCLPCGHRFHTCCLDPWVRTCGDCPNCRTGIVV